MDEYRFSPDQLRPEARRPGISAILRVRNGEDFLEAVVESHVELYDEIVAVHNQCTDDTPAILERLHRRYPDRLRVYPYAPRVYPQGTRDHARTPGDSVHSVVNYTNYALARTTRRIATLLDDDHLALEGELVPLLAELRRREGLAGEMWCVSGLNLARDPEGRLGVLRANPLAGNGDHGYFEVTRDTWFEHHPRYERFRFHAVRRRWRALTYFHLKHLKRGEGFANYELERNPQSRFHRRRRRFLAHREVLPVQDFLADRRPLRSLARVLARAPGPERLRLRLARHGGLPDALAGADLERLYRTVHPRDPVAP